MTSVLVRGPFREQPQIIFFIPPQRSGVKEIQAELARRFGPNPDEIDISSSQGQYFYTFRQRITLVFEANPDREPFSYSFPAGCLMSRIAPFLATYHFLADTDIVFLNQSWTAQATVGTHASSNVPIFKLSRHIEDPVLINYSYSDFREFCLHAYFPRAARMDVVYKRFSNVFSYNLFLINISDGTNPVPFTDEVSQYEGRRIFVRPAAIWYKHWKGKPRYFSEADVIVGFNNTQSITL
jgi:hypothetical protein